MKTFPEIPESPAGRQLAWYLERVSRGVDGSSEAELGARCALNMVVRAPFPYPHEVQTGGWKRCSQSYGDFKVASVEEGSDFNVAVTLESAGDKKFKVTCEVEDSEPHKITVLTRERILEIGRASCRERV